MIDPISWICYLTKRIKDKILKHKCFKKYFAKNNSSFSIGIVSVKSQTDLTGIVYFEIVSK
jgi:hypothetical protein